MLIRLLEFITILYMVIWLQGVFRIYIKVIK